MVFALSLYSDLLSVPKQSVITGNSGKDVGSLSLNSRRQALARRRLEVLVSLSITEGGI